MYLCTLSSQEMLYYFYITGCKSRFCSRFTGMLYTLRLASRATRTAASSTKVLVNLNSNLNWLLHPSLAYGSIKMTCNTKTLPRPRPVIPSCFCQGATRLPAVACPGFKQAGGTSHEARNNACCVARLGTWDMAAPAFIKAGLLADFWRSAMVCQVVFQLLSRKMLCMQMIRRELIGGKTHRWYQQLAALLGGWYHHVLLSGLYLKMQRIEMSRSRLLVHPVIILSHRGIKAIKSSI